MVQAPIFHVNGDDPDAVHFVTRLALDYRMQFGKDVVIDLWIDPHSALVHRVEFSVEDSHGISDWTLVLTDYGAPFTIVPPAGVDR